MTHYEPNDISELLNTYWHGVNEASDTLPELLKDFDFLPSTSEVSDSQQSLSAISVSDLIPFTQPAEGVPSSSAINDTVILSTNSTTDDQDVISASTLPAFLTNDAADIKPQLSSREDFPGIHNFQIQFEPQKKITKSATWTFSEVLGKLYAVMGKQCPVHFHTSPGNSIPAGTVIRCLPTYVSPNHRSDVVVRCPNHASIPETSNGAQPIAPSSHFIRCDNRDCRYEEDEHTQKQSVVVPYRPQADGLGQMTVIYRFMCFSSCVGNLGRRQIQAVFTLESADGQLLGRRTVELRICACPGRDRRSDEMAQKTGQGLCHEATKRSHTIHTLPFNTKIAKCGNAEEDGDDDDDKIYILKVRGSKNFALLSKLNDALEIHDRLPAEQKLQIEAKRAQRLEYIEQEIAKPAGHPGKVVKKPLPHTSSSVLG